MTALMCETPWLNGDFSNDDATAGRVVFGLRRLLAAEAVSDELYDDLEAVLGQFAVRPSPTATAALADRLRTAAAQLVEVVPLLTTPYPAPQIRRVIELSAERPAPRDAHAHLVRFASCILTLLDQLGDIAQ